MKCKSCSLPYQVSAVAFRPERTVLAYLIDLTVQPNLDHDQHMSQRLVPRYGGNVSRLSGGQETAGAVTLAY